VLDGSSSTDPDSTPGTNDDIVSFEWYEDSGTPEERLLGSGATLSVILPLGTHAVTLKVTDGSGASDTAAISVSVVDTTPPSLTVHADATTLWPPNHEMTSVGVRWVASDTCDPTHVAVQLVSVVSSEPDDAAGNDDGATMGDIDGADLGTPDMALRLRAERNGRGPGRVYTLTYRAIDAGGHAAPGLATVTVPHNQGQGPEPLLMQLQPSSAGATTVRVYWPAVTGATGYDVITGDLGSLRVDQGVLNLGAVRVLARETAQTTVSETTTAPGPAVGRGYFFLIQQRTAAGPVGYGTETAPWPRVPGTCDGGCPGGTTTTTNTSGGPEPGTQTRR
jgi:hypothetical protein